MNALSSEFTVHRFATSYASCAHTLYRYPLASLCPSLLQGTYGRKCSFIGQGTCHGTPSVPRVHQRVAGYLPVAIPVQPVQISSERHQVEGFEATLEAKHPQVVPRHLSRGTRPANTHRQASMGQGDERGAGETIARRPSPRTRPRCHPEPKWEACPDSGLESARYVLWLCFVAVQLRYRIPTPATCCPFHSPLLSPAYQMGRMWCSAVSISLLLWIACANYRSNKGIP
jgi:hypothetical protein